MRLIMLGAPGSGKGTIAAELEKEYGVVHISTGDIFRANIKEQTPLGMEAKAFIDKGELVPDSLTIAMLEDRISQEDCKNGFLLDGFPRTIPQAQSLDRFLAKGDLKIDAVICVFVSDDKIIERVSGRRVCANCGASYNIPFRPCKIEGICDVCGGPVIQRDDDQPETVLRRLITYREKTQPLVDFYTDRDLILPADNNVNYHEALAEIHNRLTARGLL